MAFLAGEEGEALGKRGGTRAALRSMPVRKPDGHGLCEAVWGRSPFPQNSPSPKTFVFIESLFRERAAHRGRGVVGGEKGAVPKKRNASVLSAKGIFFKSFQEGIPTKKSPVARAGLFGRRKRRSRNLAGRTGFLAVLSSRSLPKNACRAARLVIRRRNRLPYTKALGGSGVGEREALLQKGSLSPPDLHSTAS